MRRTLINIIAVAIIVLLAAGVLYRKEKKTDLKKITVSEVAHSVFYAPMYVADALGYFEEEGLDVVIVLTSGADAVAASVMSGSSEIGFCGSEQSIYIYNGGEKDYLVNFAGLTKRDGSFIVGRVDKDFNIMDLKGSHIIAGREGGMPAMTLAYTLKEHGIETSDLEFDTSIAFAAMSGAFISGIGDYVALFEPTALSLEKGEYGYVVASLGALGGEVPYTTFQARKSYIEKNKDVIKSFTSAIQKGLDYTYSHKDSEIATLLIEYFPDISKNDLTTVIKRYRDNDSWYETTYITEEGFNRVKDIMKNSNKLDGDTPYDKVINNTYSKKTID